jgi:predicted permease
MGKLMQDIRYAIRQFTRNPGFALVATLTLALGIGANTAIFSVIDTVLLQPLPYPHSDRLVQLKGGLTSYPYPKGWIREYARRVKSFASVSAYSPNEEHNIQAGGASDRLFGSVVSTNLFTTLGVEPILGNFFTPDQEQFGQDHVIVLSYGFWQQHFGGDTAIVGRTMLLDGVNRTIIGVAPPQVHFPDFDTQFWIPIAFNPGIPYDPWNYFNYQAIARLKDGVSPQQAQAEIVTLHRAMLTLFPWKMPDNWAGDVAVVPLLQSVVGDARPRLLLLFGAVGLVLLVACANVANLMLARASVRQKELALRTALGAKSTRLVRQLLTESAVLAGISGALGVLLAGISLRALRSVLPPDTPRLANLALHGDVLLFAVAVTLLTGILSGTIPALQAAQRDPQDALRMNAATIFGAAHRFRVSRLLVVGQIALAVVVIIAAGVMLRSLYRLAATDPGFRSAQTLTAQVSMNRNTMRNDCAQKGSCLLFYENLLDRARAMPGVEQAAMVDRLPLTGYDQWFFFDAENHPRDARQGALGASSRIVSPGYFHLMGIRLLRGRLFDMQDQSGVSRAAIINQDEAQHLWPGEDPIGKHIEDVVNEPSPTVMNPNVASIVVGVVSDTRHENLARGSGWETYFPMAPATEKPEMSILLRSRLAPGTLAGNLRGLVAQLNPSVPVARVRTLESVITSSTAAPRSLALLLSAFGCLAILVGSIGVYSLISYTVSWRTREIGLRLAVGANRLQIAKLVLGESLALAVGGSILGAAGAAAVTRLMSRFLFETSPLDPLTYALVPLLFCLVALVAAWAPARRAAAVDPMVALRNE